MTPVHLCNSFNVLGKEHTAEKEEKEEKRIELQRYKGRKINHKPKCDVNEMSINKINKVIETFNNDVKKESEKKHNTKVKCKESEVKQEVSRAIL